MACAAPLTAKSPEDETEPTELIVLEPEMDPVTTILEKEPVPLIVVAPAKVVEPDTFRYPEVSTPVVS